MRRGAVGTAEGSLPGAAASGATFFADATTAVEGYAGPALVLDDEGGLVAANRLARASALIGFGGQIAPSLAVAAKTICRGAAAHVFRLALATRERGIAVYDVTLVGVESTKGCRGTLVLAADVTIERNLLKALQDSRALYRDLVGCAQGFAWETDARGVFTYVSPQGLAGHDAEALYGRPAAIFFAGAPPSPSPFAARARFEAEIGLRSATNAIRIFRMTAVPVLTDDGVWRGARGIGQDVTEGHDREDAARHAQRRENLLLSLLRAMGDALAPDQLRDAVARALHDAAPEADALLDAIKASNRAGPAGDPDTWRAAADAILPADFSLGLSRREPGAEEKGGRSWPNS